MLEVTMLEAAKHSQDALERAVTKIIVENSPVLEYLPMMTISGPAYRYNRERSLGTIAFRGVGATYTPDSGVINPQAEFLSILGGEVVIDKFEVEMMSNLIDLKAEKFRMKSRQAGIYFSEQFFEGDVTSNPYGFDGLRRRLAGDQLINATTGGATLTLLMLDRLLDRVVGDNGSKVLWMNDTMRRKISTLVQAQTGTGRIEYTQDSFGRQHEKYAGATIRVVRREDDGSTIMGFDEDDGSGNLDTTSIYCTRMGTDFLHGIQGKSLPAVQDFGEVQAAPQHKGRIEWYCGLVIKHPRSAARLENLNDA